MAESSRREAERRMLDVLLAEEFGGDVVLSEQGQNAPQPLPSSRPPLAAAALLLLGLGVVAATGWWGRSAVERAVAQDPSGAEVVRTKDAAEFRGLLKDAVRIRLVRQESIGAGRIEVDNGSADALDTITWPEVFAVTGDDLRTWRAELAASTELAERPKSINDMLTLEVWLPGNRVARCSADLGAGRSRLWIDPKGPVMATERMHELLAAARSWIDREHRMARGRVTAAAELDQLPLPATRLDVDLQMLEQAAKHRCHATVEQLVVRGDLRTGDWQVVLAMPKLRSLELRGCTLDDSALDALTQRTELTSLVLRGCGKVGDANRLRSLRRLERLHCIDTRLGGERLDLSVLASLPVLREFGLREAGVPLLRADLEVFLRTKLQQLLLVDIVSGTDTTVIGGLPTLQELVLVGKIEDADLDNLVELRSLRRLVLRNTELTQRGVEGLGKALPECKIDWRLDQRWFDPLYAFEYARQDG